MSICLIVMRKNKYHGSRMQFFKEMSRFFPVKALFLV